MRKEINKLFKVFEFSFVCYILFFNESILVKILKNNSTLSFLFSLLQFILFPFKYVILFPIFSDSKENSFQVSLNILIVQDYLFLLKTLIFFASEKHVTIQLNLSKWNLYKTEDFHGCDGKDKE